MADQLSLRGGTTTEHGSFTGANKEVTVDTTKKTLVVHDGATVGGHPIMRENGTNSALALGSAATPSLKFTGDPNTGIFSPGADQVAISTNGTGRLFVDSNGFVGIGAVNTGSSGAQLTTTTSATTARFIVESTNAAGFPGVRLLNGTGNWEMQVDGANQGLRLLNGASERLRIDSTGRLGLGTSSPNTRLTIASSAFSGTETPHLQLLNTSAGVGTTSNLEFIAGGTGIDNTRKALIQAISGTSSSSNLTFWTTADGTTLSERLRITGAGNVGIGTTSPTSPFTVRTASGNEAQAEFSGANTGRGLKISTGSATLADALVIYDAQTSTGQHAFNIAGTEAVRIDNSRRLLVGTSTDRTGYRVQVEGTDENTSSLSLTRNSNDSTAAAINFGKSRGTSLGSNTLVIAGDRLGTIRFRGADGSALLTGALIEAKVDVTPGANDLPTRLEFSTTADGASSPTERMRITNTGLVGLGVTAPSARLTVLSPDTTGGVGTGSTIAIPASNGAAPLVINYNSIATDSTQALRLGVGTTERVRIGTAGILSSFNDSGDSHQIRSAAGAGTTDKFVVGVHGASSPTTGGITSINIFTNGNITNTNNSYAGISDIKLKENIIDASSQWEDLKALQVRKYNFKEKTGQQTHTQIGLVAQEAELVSPGLVSESPDRDADGNDLGTVTKAVNYSVLYMKAVKALQEAMERIETLEAKVAALEAS